MKRGVHVIGAGGHAKVVIATLQANGIELAAAWDDDPGKFGSAVLGVAVAGAIADCPSGELAVLAIGSNRLRQALASRLHQTFVSVVHPTAFVHESAVLGAGAVVFAGAVIQPGVLIGEHVIVNTGSSVDHDCHIGSFVHVAPGVRLGGAVTVEEGAFMGIGSCAIPASRIGAWAIVGAGSVVVRGVPAGVTAVGCPARSILGRSGV